MTKQRKETGDGERLVAVSEDSIVYGVLVEVEGQKGHGGVDRDHEENADDTAKDAVSPNLTGHINHTTLTVVAPKVSDSACNDGRLGILI